MVNIKSIKLFKGSKGVMSYMRKLFIFLLSSLICNVYACKLGPNSSWEKSDEDAVKLAKYIIMNGVLYPHFYQVYKTAFDSWPVKVEKILKIISEGK